MRGMIVDSMADVERLRDWKRTRYQEKPWPAQEMVESEGVLTAPEIRVKFVFVVSRA